METLSLSCFFFLLLCLFPMLTGGDPIHDLLKSHGLPPGLLPKSVTSFTFDRSTSLLEAHLEKPCYAKYDSLAHFDRVVTGNLSFGQLKGVDGLKQEELFVWLPVKGIFNTNPGSGVILIDIGLARKQLSMSLFETPPDCRPDGILEGGNYGELELDRLDFDGVFSYSWQKRGNPRAKMIPGRVQKDAVTPHVAPCVSSVPLSSFLRRN